MLLYRYTKWMTSWAYDENLHLTWENWLRRAMPPGSKNKVAIWRLEKH